MSRFAESDLEEDDEASDSFQRETAAAYRMPVVQGELHAFLAFLDAMPIKRIIDSRFMEPKTGEVCAVAAFCKHKGFNKLQMLKTEGESFRERHENTEFRADGTLVLGTEENDGWDGATVNAGISAGLPHAVAYDLAWRNDMNWTQVDTGVIETVTVKASWGETTYKRCAYRPMTPEERWLKLRNYIAIKAGQPKVVTDVSNA